ncbi:MAG: polysaccharide biosynthesis protein [Parvibaculum sp.]|nr:polysaccharide biosynthesis protein [Parvibaculum sp.]
MARAIRQTRLSIGRAESLCCTHRVNGVDLVLHGLFNGWGGTITCPRSPSYTVADMAAAIGPNAEHRVIGARPGEKRHESMFSLVEASFVVSHGSHYVVTPQTGRSSIEEYCEATGARKLSSIFEYDSGSNPERLSVEDLRLLISSEMGGGL